jgi:head-tail adaptor
VKIAAAHLDWRVAFDAPVITPDGMGGQQQGWAPAYTCRAHFRFLRGGEAVQAARLVGRQPVVVTIRAGADAEEISPDWRLRDLRADVAYAIRAIVPTEDRAWLELTCESGVAL